MDILNFIEDTPLAKIYRYYVMQTEEFIRGTFIPVYEILIKKMLLTVLTSNDRIESYSFMYKQICAMNFYSAWQKKSYFGIVCNKI